MRIKEFNSFNNNCSKVLKGIYMRSMLKCGVIVRKEICYVKILLDSDTFNEIIFEYENNIYISEFINCRFKSEKINQHLQIGHCPIDDDGYHF
jgi:hypothetical protein